MMFGLGTVLFGFDYAIGNAFKENTTEEICQISDLFRGSTLDAIDVVCARKGSEVIFGTDRLSDRFKLVTKQFSLPADHVLESSLNFWNSVLRQSQLDSGTENLFAPMFHNAFDILLVGTKKFQAWILELNFLGTLVELGFPLGITPKEGFGSISWASK